MKGYWMTMESMLACIVIGIFLVTIAASNILATSPVDLEQTAYDILKGLDEREALRSYAVSMDYAGLEAEINEPGLSHTVEICDYEGTCAGSQPNATDIWVGSYFIAGDSEYSPTEVKLYLWKG